MLKIDLVLHIERLRNTKKSGNYQNYIIIKIGQNTETGPEDLKKYPVTPTLVEIIC